MENLNISEKSDESLTDRDKDDPSNLSEIFNNGIALFTSILETEEATNSFKVQCNVKRAISMMEDATRLVSMADIFSNNESLEEVPTDNLQYLMLPVILGTLATKVSNVDDRMHLVEVSQVYFTDFLQRAKAYRITDYEVQTSDSGKVMSNSEVGAASNSEMITKMVNTRENKLQRYREKKALESRFSVLKESKNNPNIDDETLRDYFVTWLKCYVNVAIEELEALQAEKQVLEYMKSLPPDESPGRDNVHKTKAPISKLKPIIITRDDVQKQVYGAGYPSLPVLTVDEFYEQRIKDGDWPVALQRNELPGRSSHGATKPAADQVEEDHEAIQKENQTESDDPHLRARTDAMDEYKDTHRRGWGNRANRS